MAVYLWVMWQASLLALHSAGQERLHWAGLALLPPSALLLLGWHALTPPDLWRAALLDVHPVTLHTGSEALPLYLLMLVHVLLPVAIGLPLLKQPGLPRPGFTVLLLVWLLWWPTMLLVWRR
ncbi:hypothetical protein E5F05_06145 [Deinococcus metallilatus]|uniref:Uncharacterized protein n=1 Tax=Deinococcus metallilatus TaxID=1211322 RepID=A0AAJ5JYV2_9DEIO|nr:hypothetical protein [Deinococcus metallilatus]MBB5294522.1 hypothetical protein [Deinococcus metallilatus]QBY07569.1 hypothetical protein E5F05_06145 [Deinococcus metallilatus]RXJ13985.1 hypothetical protein ERJ73_04980 [Deinococcus metallilatus]TLK29950.1 hypothetical protein FCS05_05295 [Deinococcus metallilatus]